MGADGRVEDLLDLRAICRDGGGRDEILRLLVALRQERRQQEVQLRRREELEKRAAMLKRRKELELFESNPVMPLKLRKELEDLHGLSELSEAEEAELMGLQALPEPVDPTPVMAMLQLTAQRASDESLEGKRMAIHLVVKEPSGARTQASFLVANGRARAEQGFHDLGKQWRKADHRQGVVYLCPWEDPYGGFPEHSRRCARALSLTGLPVHMQSIDPSRQLYALSDETAKELGEVHLQYQDLLETSLAKVLVEVHQLVPEEEYLHRLLVHPHIDAEQLARINRFRVVYTVWERDRVPEHVVRYLNAMGQCWVANPHDLEMLARCGVAEERIRVVPIPFRDDDPHLAFRWRTRTPGPPRLYHIGKWEPRKNHHDMIGAYLMAFEPGEARFSLKTSTSAPQMPEYPRTPDESVTWWLEHPGVKEQGWTLDLFNRDVSIYREHISDEMLLQMHRMGDIYLSLSRGEGFDMPAFDAKLSGNLMVYTPSGGPQSFASEQDVRVEPIGTIPCHPIYRWGDAEYLDWSVVEAAGRLREAVRRVRQGIRGEVDLSGFTMAAVGDRMRSYVAEVLDAGHRTLEQQPPRVFEGGDGIF
jgi:glycosyltransferase involved in cell wall biosynthesis